MSKGQRVKGARSPAARPPRPRWAGADGFDAAWALTERYVDLADRARSDDARTRTMAAVDVLAFRRDLASRQVGTLEAVVTRAATARRVERTPRERRRPAPDDTGPPEGWDADAEIGRLLPTAEGLALIARSHREALTTATPVLFDPLTAPALDDAAVDGLRLPFPAVTCDFLNALGMSMPVGTSGGEDEWVGLIAATFQQDGDALDVWPVVTTLAAAEDEGPRHPQALSFGRVRFGGPLPDAPDGLTLVQVGSASAWVVDPQHAEDPAKFTKADSAMWTKLWVIMPALAAASALRLLEAVNVSLLPAELPRPVRRRAAREGAEIPLEVVIRTSRREGALAAGHTVEWQHRWTVRGHWKHFTKGPVFNANPRKHVYDANGNPCVRVWCPPFVKGPSDRPLILKARRMDHEREQESSS